MELGALMPRWQASRAVSVDKTEPWEGFEWNKFFAGAFLNEKTDTVFRFRDRAPTRFQRINSLAKL
jgi:hypothetical protein